jgi:alkylation response protein AidB-like acyl-CoA dehydrogenase
MTISPTELRDLTATLRKALGTDAGQPAVDLAWRARWPALAELGLTALCVAEEHGGSGNEVAAALVTAQELGAVLNSAPYPAAAAAMYALSRWLPDSRVIAQGCSGAHVPTLGFLDSGCAVTEHPGGLRVDGPVRLVGGADEADSFLLLRPGDDTMLFIPRDGADLAFAPQSFDVSRSCADVTFSATRAVPVAADPGGSTRVELLYGLLLAGDTLGGLSRMLDRTVAYARDRTAFGKPIGAFQAVQHRLVDHTLRLRGMTLLAAEAAALLAEDAAVGTASRRVLVTEAAVASGSVAMLHDLLQLTGAIGFTWEYGLHYYERRAHLNARLGRNPRRALSSLARLEGWAATPA